MIKNSMRNTFDHCTSLQTNYVDSAVVSCSNVKLLLNQCTKGDVRTSRALCRRYIYE